MARQVVTFGLPRGPPFHQAMASTAAVRTARGMLAVGITVVPWRKYTVLLLSGVKRGVRVLGVDVDVVGFVIKLGSALGSRRSRSLNWSVALKVVVRLKGW
jgi:hypothetical protein